MKKKAQAPSEPPRRKKAAPEAPPRVKRRKLPPPTDVPNVCAACAKKRSKKGLLYTCRGCKRGPWCEHTIDQKLWYEKSALYMTGRCNDCKEKKAT